MRSEKPQQPTLSAWYNEHKGKFANLTDLVVSTLQSLFKAKGIDYLIVTGRIKTLESFLEKVKRKGYKNPVNQLTDLSAVRVITYLELDVGKISELIKGTFEVDTKNSLDKASLLGIDKLGYRSVHFVCRLGKKRIKLPEFHEYGDMVFEIQIRTVLQHAWAELTHDRNYKFSGVLPRTIQRKLHLYAGMLEIADKGFDEIAGEIDKYIAETGKKTAAGQLDIEITTASLLDYLSVRVKKFKWPKIEEGFIADQPMDELIKELQDFGIKTIKHLDALFVEQYLKLAEKYKIQTTYYGLVRDLMMYNDIDRYFEKAWDGSWHATDSKSASLLGEKYGEDNVLSKLENRKIDVIPEDEDFIF